MTNRPFDERFRAFADTMPDIVVGGDAGGAWDYLNRRFYEFTGVAPGNAVDAAWRAALHPDDAAENYRRFEASIRDGAPSEMKVRLRGADGTYRWFMCRSAPVRDEHGSVIAWFGMCSDVDELARGEHAHGTLIAAERSARAEAEAASQAKDDFLATLSHELRSPLGAVLNWCQLLKAGRLDPEETARALATIERNTRLQVRLIDDILDVARIANGKIVLEMQPVELSALVAAAVESAQPLATAKGVALEATPPDGAARVCGDAIRLQQVVGNVIENAIKFTPHGGLITLCIAADDAHARLIVADSGNGIAPEVLPYVFDRFRQAASSEARKQRGLGLGLAIVRNLVEAHGGTVTAASPGLGQGTTITVELPLESAATTARREAVADNRPAERIAPRTPGVSLAGLRVVVADDDPDTLELMKEILTASGADVATAASASEVFDVLQQGRPDVLISDIGMPDADGYALLRKVRAPDTGERGMVPAIAVTGRVTADDRQRALAAG